MLIYSRQTTVFVRMNERILVPLDDSDPARTALLEALEMFASKEIIVLHVIELESLSHGVAGPAAKELDETREEEADELFDEVQAMAENYDVSLDTVIGKGDAAEAIVETAKEHNIDHIVMGSHGRSGLSRIVVGSVAEDVIRSSPVSVTISRSESTHDE